MMSAHKLADNPNVKQPSRSILLLPEETLVRVFKHLDKVSLCRMALTCRAFARLANQPKFWHTLRLPKEKHHKLSDEALAAIIRRHRDDLYEIDLTDCSQLDDLTPVFTCSRLRSLTLAGCRMPAWSDIRAVSPNLPYLERLDLSRCTQLTDEAVWLALYAFPALQELILDDCSAIQLSVPIDRTVSPCDPNTGQPNYHRPLKSISLNNTKVDSFGIGRLLSCCPDLEKISLSMCFRIDDYGMERLSNAAHLEQLHVNYCTDITDRGVSYLRNCHKLHFLNIRNCGQVSEDVFETLKPHVPLRQVCTPTSPASS
jgi:F-box/leucine-rich repeat protein 2/20